MTAVSIIESVRDYLKTYSGLKAGSPFYVDNVGPDAPGYSIIPLAGAKIVERFIDKSSTREFPFALRSMERTSADLERLENIGFYEAFSDWLEASTDAGIFTGLTLPQTPKAKTVESIEATQWGYLYEQGQSEKGIYQIICKLTYYQAP